MREGRTHSKGFGDRLLVGTGPPCRPRVVYRQRSEVLCTEGVASVMRYASADKVVWDR
jgi:hypothetical protein